MFFHLTQLIDHGIIDNRVPGIVDLSLWVKGEEHPMVFKLEGDCLRDIAGCRLEFRLKHETPENMLRMLSSLPERGENLPALPGVMGDMTASKRTWKSKNRKTILNSMYLEWFCEEEGAAYLIDSNQCELSVSLPEWTMDSCDEQAQIMTNQQVLRDYVLTWIEEYSLTSSDPDPIPDHRWDTRLREAEGIALIYQEIHQKFGSHPLGEIAEAFVMGWDSRLDKMADSDENGTAFSCKIRGALNIFDILDEEEAIEAQLCMSHPLFQKILSFTEYIHATFSGLFEGQPPPYPQVPPEITQLFEMVRYITPNILSCLLQINSGDANYSQLTTRMSRCSGRIEQSVNDIKKGQENNLKLEEMLSDLLSEAVSMQNDFAKQVNH